MNIELGSDTEGSVDSDDTNEDRGEIFVVNTEESDEEPADSTDHTFDPRLPMLHSYLGRHLNKLSSPSGLLDDTVYLNLPLLPRGYFVLFPGQILPMKVLHRDIIHMLQNWIQTHHLFGVVCESNHQNARTGTIAEIFECDNRFSGLGLSLKARGRKRFKILRVRVEDGYESADVKILPEIVLDPPLFAQRLMSLDRMRFTAITKEDLIKREKLDRLDACMGLWPSWVYKQYDVLRLSLELRKLLKFIEARGCIIPTDPVELSYWFAQNFLLEDKDKLAIFNYDSAIDRLRQEIEYLKLNNYFACCNCGIFISLQTDMFPMSKEGPQAAYVNARGRIYEVITLLSAQGLKLAGNEASTSCTWFPGYGWIIACCEICGAHIGWKFIAMQKDLTPKIFWALSRKGLRVNKILVNNRLTVLL